jgi:hypothetical protein
MYIMSNCALFLLTWQNIRKGNYIITFFAVLLLGVSLTMVIHAIKSLKKTRTAVS